MHTIVGKSEHAYPHIMSLATTKSGPFDASLLDAEDIYMLGEMRTEEENFSRRKLVKQTPVDEIEPSVHQCVHYTRKVTKLHSLNDPPLRCVMCDPTTSFCNPLCQKWLNYQFAACRGLKLVTNISARKPNATWRHRCHCRYDIRKKVPKAPKARNMCVVVPQTRNRFSVQAIRTDMHERYQCKKYPPI